MIAFLLGCGQSNGGPHSVTLSWAASKSNVVGYNVYRTLLSNGHTQKLNAQPIQATQYVDSTVEAGQAYSYSVTSVDYKGSESPPSEAIVAKVPR